MKHIIASVPETDRWYPIMVRLVDGLGARLDSLGIDPDTVEPSPDGSGEIDPTAGDPATPDQQLPCDDKGLPDGVEPGCLKFDGRITHLCYDCRGQFEGFILSDCLGEHAVYSDDCGVEALVERACRDCTTVTAILAPRRFAPDWHLKASVNRTCPWSGNPVTTRGLTSHRGYVAGFCGEAHRDRFEQASLALDAAVTDASADQDPRIPINRYCPWSGKPISRDATTQYRSLRVGFCCPGHRDKFAKAVEYFEAACCKKTGCESSALTVRKLLLHC